MEERELLLKSTPARSYSNNASKAPVKRPSKLSLNRMVDASQIELSGCGGTICCHPGKWLHRAIVLILICLLGFGSYFCYDSPSALQDDMKKDLKISTSQFMSLYAWYSWPNVVLCFFGGFLLDSVFGLQLGAVIFCCFVVAGQFTFALGAYLNKFALMQVGRFLLGTGGESLAVAQNTYAVTWFKGKELNMVFGLQMSFARAGSTVNMNVMGPLYQFVGSVLNQNGYQQLGIALLLAGTASVMSLCCALWLGYLDTRANRILKTHVEKNGEVINIADVKDFSAAFWILCSICVAFSVTLFPFISLGVVFFESKYDFTKSQATAVNGLTYIVSAVASPLLGLMVDKCGYNVTCVVIAIIMMIGSHSLLAFSFLTPYVAVSIMGLSYSLFASALWTTVAYVVPEHQLGTAYGIMQAIQNLGLASISLVCGIIVDNSGHFILEIFFLGLLSIALIAAIVLYFLDAARELNLNLSAKHRREMEEEIANEERLEEEISLEKVPLQSNLMQLKSDLYFRNRYLSKLGAKLPEHYNVYTSELVRRSLGK